MPRLPTFPASPEAPSEPVDRGSERCWMIVLLTANLKGAWASAGAFAGFDSEMSEERILPCIEIDTLVRLQYEKSRLCCMG